MYIHTLNKNSYFVVFYYSLILVKPFYISGFSFSTWKVGILALNFSLSCKTIERLNESEGVALNLALFVCLHENGCISIFGQDLILWNWVVGYFQQTKIRSVFYIFIQARNICRGQNLRAPNHKWMNFWSFISRIMVLLTLYYQCLKYDTQ